MQTTCILVLNFYIKVVLGDTLAVFLNNKKDWNRLKTDILLLMG